MNWNSPKIAIPAAFLLGSIAALGFSPLHWGVLSLAAYPCLYRLIFTPEFAARSPWRRIYRCVVLIYVFYAGNYALSLFWIAEAPLHYSQELLWMSVLTIVLVPLILPLFIALPAFAVALLKGGYSRMIALALALSLAEYGRGHLFTGFPWNMPAHLLLGAEPLLQNVAWAGLYGSNLLLLIVLILPAGLFYHGKHSYVGALVSLVMLVGGYGYGVARTAHEVVPEALYGVRIVQAGIAGQERWQADKIQENIFLSLKLSQEKRPPWVKAIIWGEAVLPFDFTAHDAWRELIANAVPEKGVLIAGASRYDRDEKVYYNSLLGIDGKGERVIAYDKHHLVPFGEYVPLQEIIPLPAIAAEGSTYGAGEPPQVMKTDNMPHFIPLICYEIIFPHLRRHAYEQNNNAQFILNLTNDEWYKPQLFPIAIGYYQHLQMARFAAVESGLPVVRAASTGISAVINHKGQISETIKYNKQGTLDSLIPPRKVSPSLRYGDLFFIGAWLILMLALLGDSVYSQFRKPQS